MSQAARKRPPLRSAFRALGIPNYRLFWCGQLASLTGSWMQRIAQAWLVLQLTDSPLALGTVTAIQFTPILLFSLVGGALADRFPKRRVILITQTVMLLQAAAMAVLAAAGVVQVWHVYVLAAVLGLASAIDNPTRQSFVVEMVGPADLQNAVALNSAQFNTSRILGPALGGLLIAVIGVAGCFALNAASYLAVIGGLLLMRADRLFAPTPATKGRLLGQIGEGLRYAATTPDVALIAVLLGAIGTFGYNFTLILPLIAQYVLGEGPLVFGLLTSAMGLGSLGAALGLAYSGRPTRRTLLAGAAGFSLLLAGVGLSRWLPLTLLLLAALGLCSIVFSATANTRLQLVTPPQLRGRVMGLYALLFAGTTPIGSLVVGTAAERVGVQAAVAGASALCGVGVAVGLLYARRAAGRLLPDPPPAAEEAEGRATLEPGKAAP
jgi:MFS family permease